MSACNVTCTLHGGKLATPTMEFNLRNALSRAHSWDRIKLNEQAVPTFQMAQTLCFVLQSRTRDRLLTPVFLIRGGNGAVLAQWF